MPKAHHFFLGTALRAAQQGQALAMLVGHLAAQGDAIDLTGTASTITSKAFERGRRCRQTWPSDTTELLLPASLSECIPQALPFLAGPSDVGSDARRRSPELRDLPGKIRRIRDLALILHQLAFIGDCLVQDDVCGAREHLGLALAATEQASQDGNWSVAYLLTVLEEPSPQVFSSTAPASSSSRLQAFSPLVSPAWGSTTLAFVREVDLLTQRRKDAALPKAIMGQSEDL